MASPHVQALAKVQHMLDFVLHPCSRDTSGIAVNDPALLRVKTWASKQQDPIDGEYLPDASQTVDEFVAKGLFKDKFTAALLNGIEPEDGGSVGTPIESDGNGDCLLNSVAAFFAKTGNRGVRSAVKTMAVKLRLSIVLNGFKYMELFLLDQEHHFGTWYNYTSDVREMLTKNGWDVEPDTDNNWSVGSPDCARLIYLAQLWSIARPGVWLQQFVFPILATVVQSPLRVYIPFNSLNAANGGPWKHTLFLPVFLPAKERSTLHVVLTICYSSSYTPPFDNAADYLRYVKNNLPELNHFVTMSNDNAPVAKELALSKFEELKFSAIKAAAAARSKLQEALLDPSPEQMNLEQESVLNELKDDVAKAESHCKKCDADFDRIKGNHVIPFDSAADAAAADQESFNIRVEDAIQKRKADAAAKESHCNSDGVDDPGSEYSGGSGDGLESGESEASRETKERGRKRRECNMRRRKDASKGSDMRGVAPEETVRIAKTGRSFDIVGSPRETWDAVFETLLREFRFEGHCTLQICRKKKTADKSRYKHCEVICAYSGHGRKKNPTKEEFKPRKSLSKKSCHQHNHDPQGLTSRAANHILMPSIVEERIDDIRKWTARRVPAKQIFKLLELDKDGLKLCKVGKRKVYNEMQKINDELNAKYEDATNLLVSLKSESGMYCEHTLDAHGRLVDIFWSTVEQQEQITRFGGCVQLDTTVFTNRYRCPLLFVVGVDGENRSFILGQGLLRSECTETLEWILDKYEAAAGGRKPKVILTDDDLAIPAAVASCWPDTLHMYCLWYVFKNVLKKCSSSFAGNDEETDVMRCFRSAAYAPTPEVFATQQARLEQMVAGRKCQRYMADLIRNKTKWAFCYRPTVLTLGMVATQRTEGLFRVAKRLDVDKKLSLCALWGRLQNFNKMLAIETGRLATPPIASGLAFRDKHAEEFYEPVKRELLVCGASQYCQREVRAQVDGSQSYEAEMVTSGCVDDNGDPLPLDEDCLDQIHSLRLKLNILHVAPSDTDLEVDPFPDEAASDNTMWARTSLSAFLDLIATVPIELVVAVRYKYTANRPSHLVVFGPDNFHLCSCLKLLRRGLPCRHYFAVLVNSIGRTGGREEMIFNHTFNGACVHNRWRQSKNDNDLPWSVSSVLLSSGHGAGWDGHHKGSGDNYWGLTCDETSDGVLHSKPAVREAQDRYTSAKRRVYACMMTKSKYYVEDIMRSVPLNQALTVQDKVGDYVRFLLNSTAKSTDLKNPGKSPKKGKPKNDDKTQSLQHGTIVKVESGNPEGQQGHSQLTRRMDDFKDSHRPAKISKTAADHTGI